MVDSQQPNRIERFVKANIHMIWQFYSVLPENQHIKIIFPFEGIPTVMQWGITDQPLKKESVWIIPRSGIDTIKQFYQHLIAEYFENEE